MTTNSGISKAMPKISSIRLMNEKNSRELDQVGHVRSG